MSDCIISILTIYIAGVIICLPFAGMLYEKTVHDNPPGNHTRPIGRYGLAWIYSLFWPVVIVGVIANDFYEVFDR